MFKYTLLGAVALSAVSFNAHAADSSEACGAFDNSLRFNPTELSEFQECWLDFHYPEETAGTLGSLFWVKVGDSFVSMPVSNLQSAGSKGGAKAIVVDQVEARLLEMAKEEIANKEAIIAMLRDNAEATAADIADLNRMITEKSNTITSLEMARDALQATVDANGTTIGGLNATIENLNTQISDLRAEVAALFTQAQVDGFVAAVDITTDNQRAIDAFVNGRSFEDGHGSTVSISVDGNTLTITGDNAAMHDLLNGRALEDGVSQSDVNAVGVSAVSLERDGSVSVTLSNGNTHSYTWNCTTTIVRQL